MESVLEEWKVRSKNLLKNVINRGKSVLQKRRVYEIAILLGDTLFMCTMQEGRFVKQKEYRLETVDETSLEEVFCRAVVDLFLIEAAQAPKILLLGGNKEGRLVSWDGQSKAATYSLSLFDQESENVNFIMNKIKMNYINKEIYFFPYAEGIQVAKKWIELLKLHGFTVFNIKEISWAAKKEYVFYQLFLFF